MPSRSVRFTTTLSPAECDSIFKTAAASPMFKNKFLRLGERINEATGAQQSQLFTPEKAPGYFGPGEEPLFSIGWSFENKYGASFVQMDVWDRDGERTVELFVPNSSNKHINRFIEAFRSTDRTDLS